MSQFNAPAARRSGGDLDVYTGLLVVSLILLVGGVIYLAMTNIAHSSSSAAANDGGMFKLVEKSSSGRR